MQHYFSAPPLYSQADMGRPALKPQPAYGAHLAKLRETAGFTQKQLAEKLGVPISNITFWERSDKPPHVQHLSKLSEILSVDIEVLLMIKEPKRRPTVVKGRLLQVFEAAAHLPRRQQQKVAEFLEAFVNQHSNGHHRKAA